MKHKSLSSSAMLLDMNISIYTGRKQDKATATEVNTAKGARSARATSVHKNLFADDADLEAINAYASKVRMWLYQVTLPWSDTGTRLVPTKAFFDISHELNQHEQEFNRLVDQFVTNYGTKVAAQAFKLGKLFDSNEYPDAHEMHRKFAFRYHFAPVPESGDFRVDIPAEAVHQLKAKFESTMHNRLQEAMTEPWDRLYNEIVHIRTKLTPKEDGKMPRLYASMLENALSLCSTLQTLNILDDPQLEEARRQLQISLETIDIEALRESPELRDSVKIKMNDLIDKFKLEI
jgi:hypothetical protein